MTTRLDAIKIEQAVLATLGLTSSMKKAPIYKLVLTLEAGQWPTAEITRYDEEGIGRYTETQTWGPSRANTKVGDDS